MFSVSTDEHSTSWGPQETPGPSNSTQTDSRQENRDQKGEEDGLSSESLVPVSRTWRHQEACPPPPPGCRMLARAAPEADDEVGSRAGMGKVLACGSHEARVGIVA